MRQPEVVAQRLGPLVGALVIGAGEQVLHQLAPDAQLGVGHPAQPGQLDREHGRAVLDRHHVRGARAAVRVHQREQAEHAGARRGQGDHAVAVPDRAARGHQPAEQLLPVVGGRLRVRVRLGRAGPRGQVAVPVLHRHGQPGQVVQGLGDAGRPFPGGRDPGQALVDLHAAAERGHGFLQRRVGLGQLRGDRALPRVQLRVGHRHPGLLRHHLGQELLLAGGLAPGAGDHVADRPGDAPHRVRPGPAAVRDRQLAAGVRQRVQLLAQLRGDRAGPVGVGPPGVPHREPGDPPRPE